VKIDMPARKILKGQTNLSRLLFVLSAATLCFALLGSGLLPFGTPAVGAASTTSMLIFENWQSLGRPYPNVSLRYPTLGWNEDGRIELFALGDDSYLYHKWQTSPNGSWSTDWFQLGYGAVWTCLAVGSNSDGRMEFVARTFAGRLWHLWQGTPNGPFGQEWADLGPPADGVQFSCPITMGRNLDGRLDIFAIGDDGNLWSKPQSEANNGWGPYVNLGRPPGGMKIFDPNWGRDQNGSQTIFVLGYVPNLLPTEVFFRFQTSPNGSWSDWVGMGRPSSDTYNTAITSLAASSNADGRQEIFAVTESRSLWHKFQLNPNSYWGSWDSLGNPNLQGTLEDGILRVGRMSDGTMHAFVSNWDLGFSYIGQTLPSNGWGAWKHLNDPSTTSLVRNTLPALGANANGLFNIFVQGNDGAIWHAQQKTIWDVYLPLVIR
jgi:hypothetical protein